MCVGGMCVSVGYVCECECGVCVCVGGMCMSVVCVSVSVFV